MKSQSFPQLQQILNSVDEALERGAHPVAAFDADGTLWSNDMGENMFRYQVEHRLLENLPANPWEHYLELHRSQGDQVGFLWLAQVNAGKTLDEVRKQAQQSFNSYQPSPVFAEQVELIDQLHKRDIEVYIVTASVQWAVEPGARLFGIPPERVIGVKTKVVEGVVTDVQDGAVTYKKGKVLGLEERVPGRKPLLAAGNSEGDLYLLEYATDVRLVIASAKAHQYMYTTEQHMQTLARDRGWFHFSY